MISKKGVNANNIEHGFKNTDTPKNTISAQKKIAFKETVIPYKTLADRGVNVIRVTEKKIYNPFVIGTYSILRSGLSKHFNSVLNDFASDEEVIVGSDVKTVKFNEKPKEKIILKQKESRWEKKLKQLCSSNKVADVCGFLSSEYLKVEDSLKENLKFLKLKRKSEAEKNTLSLRKHIEKNISCDELAGICVSLFRKLRDVVKSLAKSKERGHSAYEIEIPDYGYETIDGCYYRLTDTTIAIQEMVVDNSGCLNIIMPELRGKIIYSSKYSKARQGKNFSVDGIIRIEAPFGRIIFDLLNVGLYDVKTFMGIFKTLRSESENDSKSHAFPIDWDIKNFTVWSGSDQRPKSSERDSVYQLLPIVSQLLTAAFQGQQEEIKDIIRKRDSVIEVYEKHKEEFEFMATACNSIKEEQSELWVKRILGSNSSANNSYAKKCNEMLESLTQKNKDKGYEIFSVLESDMAESCISNVVFNLTDLLFRIRDSKDASEMSSTINLNALTIPVGDDKTASFSNIKMITDGVSELEDGVLLLKFTRAELRLSVSQNKQLLSETGIVLNDVEIKIKEPFATFAHNVLTKDLNCFILNQSVKELLKKINRLNDGVDEYSLDGSDQSFYECDVKNIIFKDIQTGKPLAKGDSNNLQAWQQQLLFFLTACSANKEKDLVDAINYWKELVNVHYDYEHKSFSEPLATVEPEEIVKNDESHEPMASLKPSVRPKREGDQNKANTIIINDEAADQPLICQPIGEDISMGRVEKDVGEKSVHETDDLNEVPFSGIDMLSEELSTNSLSRKGDLKSSATAKNIGGSYVSVEEDSISRTSSTQKSEDNFSGWLLKDKKKVSKLTVTTDEIIDAALPNRWIGRMLRRIFRNKQFIYTIVNNKFRSEGASDVEIYSSTVSVTLKDRLFLKILRKAIRTRKINLIEKEGVMEINRSSSTMNNE